MKNGIPKLLAVANTFFVLMLFFNGFNAYGQVAVPGGKCRVAALTSWSETEQWVWQQVCINKAADLSEFDKRKLKSSLSEGWDKKRLLSSNFLETILAHEPWASSIPRGGVHIRGALFNKLDMSGTEFNHSLRLENSRFTKEVFLSRINTSGDVSFDGSHFVSALHMATATIGGYLFLRRSELLSLNLKSANIGSQLNIDGLKVSQDVEMNSVTVGESLMMGAHSEFKDVNLNRAYIGRQLVMTDTKIIGLLDMNGVEVRTDLFMDGNSEFMEIDLIGGHIGGQLYMTSAKIGGTLKMDSIEIGGSLTMNKGAEFDDVDLNGANISGQLVLSEARVKGILRMSAVNIGKSLAMDEGAQFSDVVLIRANIGGVFDVRSATVTGEFDMNSATISGSVYMHELKVKGKLVMTRVNAKDSVNLDKAELTDVHIEGVNVGHRLTMRGTKVTGTLSMESSSIGASLIINKGAKINKSINAKFIRIGENFDLRGAVNLPDLALTGGQIKGELLLATADNLATWDSTSLFTLRNASIYSLQDAKASWPNHLELEGLKYQRLISTDDKDDLRGRSVDWYVNWIEKDKPYAPQPYKQLAKVLSAAGFEEKASDVLFEGRERARENYFKRGHYLEWWGATMLKYTIGYGYGSRYFYSLFWVLGMVALGAILIRRSKQFLIVGNGNEVPMRLGVFYSLDLLLPIIQLRRRHYEVDLQGFVRYYFYLHQLMGYVLASFLLTGLSGIAT